MNTAVTANPGPIPDYEYAVTREESATHICPVCQSTEKVFETSPLQWAHFRDTDMAAAGLRCDSCGAKWKEILRPVTYELEEDVPC